MCIKVIAILHDRRVRDIGNGQVQRAPSRCQPHRGFVHAATLSYVVQAPTGTVRTENKRVGGGR